MERLKRRTDFKAAAQAAKAPAGAFVLQARQRGVEAIGSVRVGFTVSRQVGNAVERNRVRRRLRELVRLAPSAALRPGHDYVVIGRRAALGARFADMVRQFDAALHRIHLKPQNGQKQAQEQAHERVQGAAEPSRGSGAPLHRAGSPQARDRHIRRAASQAQRQNQRKDAD